MRFLSVIPPPTFRCGQILAWAGSVNTLDRRGGAIDRTISEKNWYRNGAKRHYRVVLELSSQEMEIGIQTCRRMMRWRGPPPGVNRRADNVVGWPSGIARGRQTTLPGRGSLTITSSLRSPAYSFFRPGCRREQPDERGRTKNGCTQRLRSRKVLLPPTSAFFYAPSERTLLIPSAPRSAPALAGSLSTSRPC